MSQDATLILHTPQDEILRTCLELKLEEYKTRMVGAGESWYSRPPRLALMYKGYRSACYKNDVLSAVLDAPIDAPVNTQELYVMLKNQYGQTFDVENFHNACYTVAYYLGYKDFVVLDPGTGLPKPKDT